MRLAVTGRNGQIVSALRAVAPPDVEVIAIGRPQIDLARPESLREPLLAVRPDVIVSAAAYTAVDKAESEPELARTLNAHAAEALAAVAAELDVPLLHLSTDYVFDGIGEGYYDEEDPAGPVSVYGRTKLEGEQAIRRTTPRHVILRTAWVYSPFGQNFVKTMLRLAETRNEVQVVADQRGCPTEARDIARALVAIARRVSGAPDGLYGTFHLTAPDDASWFEFAQAIFAGLARRGGKTVAVRPIATEAYPTPARRPGNSRLSGKRLKAVYDIELPSWRQSLDSVLDELISKGDGR